MEAMGENFQFHKGAIETKERLAPISVSASFQFHKGAIETVARHLYSESLDDFQFHKGAIETDLTVAIVERFFTFNSIKVRLKRGFESPSFRFHALSIP